MHVTMNVNGEDQSPSEIEGRLLLVHFIRDHLGLTGTHWGCDTSNCGTCVVLDGRRTREDRAPCWPPWPTATEVRTVEDLESTVCSTRSSRASCRITACSAGSAPRA